MAAILNVWRDWHHIRKPRLRQSMRIYLKNIPAKFRPDPIWNDGALGFFWRGRPDNKKNKMSSDMRSVPDVENNTKNMTHRANTSLITKLQ